MTDKTPESKTMLAENQIWSSGQEKDVNRFDGYEYDPNNLPAEEVVFGNYRDWYVNFRESVKKAAETCGYREEEDLEVFLWNRVRNMGGTLSKKTIHNWLTKEDSRPDRSESGRDNMFQLCFALNMTDQQSQSFFSKVYMELPVQYRRKEECVYEFCLRTGRGFQNAQHILEEIQNSDTPGLPCKAAELQTAQIHDALNLIEDEDALIQFIKSQPEKKSTTGINIIKEILNSILESDLYPSVVSSESLFWAIYGFNARNSSWKGYSFQYPTFLGRKFLVQYSQLQDLDHATNDTIRKLLILLKFFEYFGGRTCDEAGLYDQYVMEVNVVLDSCGYAALYPRNPYDWLFLYCATLEYPMDGLQAFANRYWLPKENKQKPEQGHV